MANDQLVEGVYAHRLIETAERVLAAGESDDARRAIETCRRIEAELRAEIAVLEPVLVGAGIRIDGVEPVAGRQNHTITFLVPNPATGEAAVAALEAIGFSGWERWHRGALESFRRSADQITAARTEAVTTVVRFRWRERHRTGRFHRVITPTAGDWSIVELPTWAWWGYPIVRLLRLVAERAGLRARHGAGLGSFLSTPDSLLDPLVDHAAVTADDVVVDLGAGDGRLPVAAARRTGCSAIGVEHEGHLVDAARQWASTENVADRVEFVHGDARAVDLSVATVIFMFLPIDVVDDLIDLVLASVRSGARVVVHEQSRLPPTLHPSTSTLLVGDDAVTVAHVWHAP
jgi:SAM-dependent methyltransferase